MKNDHRSDHSSLSSITAVLNELFHLFHIIIIIVLDASLTTGQASILFLVLFGLYAILKLLNMRLKKNLNDISQNSHVRYIKILT